MIFLLENYDIIKVSIKRKRNMNINDLRFDTDLNKASSDFDMILSLITECKENHLWEGSTLLNNIENQVVELLQSIEEYQAKTKIITDIEQVA